MVIGILNVGMQAIYGIEVKSLAARGLVDIYNGTARERFKHIIAAEPIRKGYRVLGYMTTEYCAYLICGWLCPVYGPRHNTAVTLDPGADSDIFV